MKLEALTTAAGRLSFRSGDIINVSDEDGRDLIKCGAARGIVSGKKPDQTKTQPKKKASSVSPKSAPPLSAIQAAMPRKSEE